MKQLYRNAHLPILLAAIIAFSDIAAADPVLSVSNLSLEQGEAAVLSVNATGLDPAWAGINATLQLPEGVELVDASSDLEPAFEFDHHFDAGTGQASIILYAAGQSFGTTAIEVAELNVHATHSAVIGDHPVSYITGLTGVSVPGGTESVPHTTLNGILTILLGASLPMRAWPVLLVLLIAVGATRLRRSGRMTGTADEAGAHIKS